MDNAERRRDVRARVALPTLILRRSGEEPVQMVDASFRGLFVRVAEPPQVRELLKLRVTLPTRDILIHGVVVRIVEDPYIGFGVGLRCFALNGQDRIDWEAFIASIVAPRATRAA